MSGEDLPLGGVNADDGGWGTAVVVEMLCRLVTAFPLPGSEEVAVDVAVVVAVEVKSSELAAGVGAPVAGALSPPAAPFSEVLPH